MTNREFTLKWLQDQGYPHDDLPAGIPDNTRECVVAKAMNMCGRYAGHTVSAYIDGEDGFAYIAGGTTRYDIPFTSEIVEFIREFDRGEHSDLIEIT